MTYPHRILDSNPAPEVKRLLDSATLDRPSLDSKVQAKARALSVLREQEVGSTTQLTAFALGGTVSRLLSAVTLVDKPVSALRLAFRGALLGTAIGAAALSVIAMQRFLRTPQERYDSSVATQPAAVVAKSPQEVLAPSANQVAIVLAQTERDLNDGRPLLALNRLDSVSSLALTAAAREQAMVLRVRTLVALGRDIEAQKLVTRAKAAQPSASFLGALETALTKK